MSHRNTRHVINLLPCPLNPGFGIDWTVDKCNKYLIGWEAALPTIGAAAAGALLLIRCYGRHCCSSHNSEAISVRVD